ncbi:unnamed protein product [Paramecium sonneborni]|uniref:WD40-repeat-containing domain n=1 Tax=Paramecium sonneborni TaxID=65129 RepID=A0A8S1P282_9CILI|nr:unnamed protein product [Paramecium sonneborni]
MIEIANQLSNPNSFKIFKQNVDSQYHQFITESKKLLGQFLKGNQIRSQSLKNPEFKLLQNINKQDNQQKQNKKMYLLWIFLPIILAILCIIQLNLFQISTQVIDFDQSINSQAFNSSQNKSQDNDIFIIDSIHKHISKEDNQSNINFNITRPGVDINQEQIYKFKENKSLLEKAQQNQKKKTYQQEQLEKSFKYELIYSINQSQWCGAISFNKDSSFLIASSEKNINIFEFKKGLIQTLEQHKDWVTALYFMKNSNDFISGSADKSIIIWKFMENKLWQRKQQLIGHESTINRVIMNSKEDLIISCSSDKTIKIWKKQNDLWFLAQTILEHNKDVYSISLSESENKLISCGQDGQILVMEQQKNNQEWIVIQKIETKVFGYRLSFIGDNQFTFQPHRGEFMHLYELNNLTKQYLKIKDIQVKNGNVEDQSLFSQQYIKEKSLLINKYGRVINLVQKNQNGEFLNKQQIEFGHYYLYGSVTDNGEYLVTWNSKNNQLQIRQFQEK